MMAIVSSIRVTEAKLSVLLDDKQRDFDSIDWHPIDKDLMVVVGHEDGDEHNPVVIDFLQFKFSRGKYSLHDFAEEYPGLVTLEFEDAEYSLPELLEHIYRTHYLNTSPD